MKFGTGVLLAIITIMGVVTNAWSSNPNRSPNVLASDEMVLEFNDNHVEHDMGCGGSGSCLVAELMEVVSPNGIQIGTAREEVYEIQPKVGTPGAHVRAKLFFIITGGGGEELGRLETDEFIVDAALAEVANSGQMKFNTHWYGTVHGTSGAYSGMRGKMHMRGHNVTHLDPATGVILVDEFYNTYIISHFRRQ